MRIKLKVSVQEEMRPGSGVAVQSVRWADSVLRVAPAKIPRVII
jgi:hypothetical protein